MYRVRHPRGGDASGNVVGGRTVYLNAPVTECLTIAQHGDKRVLLRLL